MAELKSREDASTVSEISDRIAVRIRELRLAKGWSQEQLAEATGLSRDAVSRIERGDRSPSLDTLNLVARALGTSLPQLVDVEEPLPRTQEADDGARAVQHWLDQLEPVLADALLKAVRVIAQAAVKHGAAKQKRSQVDGPRRSDGTA